MEISLDALQGDPTALRAIILARHQRIVGIEAANRAYDALVQALKIAIARLRKQRFGASSEKIEREIEQLELALESLETARAAPLRRRSRPGAGAGRAGGGRRSHREHRARQRPAAAPPRQTPYRRGRPARDHRARPRRAPPRLRRRAAPGR